MVTQALDNHWVFPVAQLTQERAAPLSSPPPLPLGPGRGKQGGDTMPRQNPA